MFIRKNRINDFVITATERQTLTNPYYLFSFLSHSTKSTVNVICPSLSSNSRYDLFRLTESGSTYQNFTGATVNLQEGFHTYSLYEQTSNTNTSLNNVTGLLETGLCLVSGSTPQIIYSSATDTMNYTFYQ